MWTPRIVIDQKEVLAHGTLVSKGSLPIDIYPFPAPSDSYVVRITFETRPGEGRSVRYGVLGTTGFQLNMINYDSDTIGGHISPIYVALHKQRRVMLSLASEAVGQADTATRVLHYTFFDGGAAP